MEQYGRFLGAAIARLCPKDLGLECDDIRQEASLRLWRALSSGREIPSLASYIYRVAVTTTIDAVRRVKARREQPLDSLETEPESAPQTPVAAAENAPDRVAQHHQVVEKVTRALAGLSENRRRATGLYLQGMTTREIGELLGWSEAKARNLAYRGLEDLRGRLRAEGIEYEISRR